MIEMLPARFRITLCLVLVVQILDGNPTLSITPLTCIGELISDRYASNSSEPSPQRPTWTTATSSTTRGDLGAEQDKTQAGFLFAQLQSQLLGSKRAQEFFVEATKYGLPSYDNLMFRDNFIISYDNRLRHPNWVLEHLTRQQLKIVGAVRHLNLMFRPDDALHEYFRSTNDDFMYSGYDRGHMAPACDNMSNKRFLDESFLFSNVAPQVHNLNGGGCVWTRLESYVLYLARRTRSMHIITGTLYMPQDDGIGKADMRDEVERSVTYRLIGDRRIGVPTHLYKVFIKENFRGYLSMEAFLVPNSKDVDQTAKFEEFRIDVDRDLSRIERITGLQLFNVIDRKKVAKPKQTQYRFGVKPKAESP